MMGILKVSRKFWIPILCLVLFTCLSIEFSEEVKSKSHTQKVKISADIEITIETDTPVQDDGSYLIGSKLTFRIDDNNYGKVVLELEGSKRLFTLELDESSGEWTIIWDTNEPEPGDDPVTPDTYDITLKIDGSKKSCNPDKIEISEQQEGFGLIIIIIIAGLIAVVSISALIVVKKKKAEDIEFSDIEKNGSKKKRKIYSGASSIGKRSGQLAESRLGSRSNNSVASKSTPRVKGYLKSDEIHKPFGVEIKKEEQPQAEIYKFDDIKDDKKRRKAPQKAKQMMPESGEFHFETRKSAGMAILKNKEMKLDRDQKVNFLISKVESMIQNIEFFKVILEQHEQTELYCKDCNKIMSEYWITCPYCEIKESNEMLSLKQSLLSISDDVKFCPACKRIIKAYWAECPYCFVK